MTTTNIIPNALSSSAGTVTVTGAASVVAALTDGSDASYVQVGTPPGGGAFFIVDNSTFTIPAGAVITEARVKWRAAYVTGPAQIVVGGGAAHTSTSIPSLTASVADYIELFTPSQSFTDQAGLDAWQLYVGTANPARNDFRIMELSTDVTYVLAPTTTVSAPSGVISTTTSPTAAWTHVSSGGLTGQTKYQIRVFTAAQYGAGGFDPATSVAAYDSGVVVSLASSATIGPLPNGTTYRAYVRTAQNTNGIDQWAPYAFSGFSISLTTSDITSVVATPDNTNGRNQIVVTRNAATPLWTSVEVQASYDGGATWSYVRGYTKLTSLTSPFTLFDYEAPNGVAVQYRARATYQLSGQDVTSNWVLSSAVTWTADSPCSLWLKDPSRPSRNIHLDAQMPDTTYDRTVGVFRPVGAGFPVVVSDVLQAGTSTITIVTRSDAEATALRLIASGSVLLLQTPASAGWQWGSRYVAPGALQEAHTSPAHLTANRVWTLALVEVARPADDGLA